MVLPVLFLLILSCVQVSTQSTECTVTEDFPAGVVTITCSTTTDLDSCSFTWSKDGGVPFNITNPVEYRSLSGPSYSTSLCFVSVPIRELGEGTHSFKGYVYPASVANGSFVNEIDADRNLTLSFPEASHTCSPAPVDGYFLGTSARCECRLRSAGHPSGTTHWAKAGLRLGSSGDLLVTYDKNQSGKIYACEAESLLGWKFGSYMTARFAFFMPDSIEIELSPDIIDTCGNTSKVEVTCRVSKMNVSPAPTFVVSVGETPVGDPGPGTESNDDVYYERRVSVTQDGRNGGGRYQVKCRVINGVTNESQEKTTAFVVRDDSSSTFIDKSSLIGVGGWVSIIIVVIIIIVIVIVLVAVFRTRRFKKKHRNRQGATQDQELENGGGMIPLENFTPAIVGSSHQPSSTAMIPALSSVPDTSTQRSHVYEAVDDDTILAAQRSILQPGTFRPGARIYDTPANVESRPYNAFPTAASRLHDTSQTAASRLQNTLAAGGSRLHDTSTPRRSRQYDTSVTAGSRHYDIPPTGRTMLRDTQPTAGSKLHDTSVTAASRLHDTQPTAGSRLRDAAIATEEPQHDQSTIYSKLEPRTPTNDVYQVFPSTLNEYKTVADEEQSIDLNGLPSLSAASLSSDGLYASLTDLNCPSLEVYQNISQALNF